MRGSTLIAEVFGRSMKFYKKAVSPSALPDAPYSRERALCAEKMQCYLSFLRLKHTTF